MKKQILVINPNSTKEVTNAMDAAFDPLRDLTGPSITSITNSNGPPGIESQEHADKVAIQVLDIVKEKEILADAFVIACFSDPGINSTREFTSKPVFGIAESGILSALSLGNKFGIIAILDRSIPRHIRYIRSSLEFSDSCAVFCPCSQTFARRWKVRLVATYSFNYCRNNSTLYLVC